MDNKDNVLKGNVVKEDVNISEEGQMMLSSRMLCSGTLQ